MAIIDELKTLVSYYGAKLNGAQIDLYIDALADIPANELHGGIVELIKTLKWMPKVSEIRQATAAYRERQNTEEVHAWHDERNVSVLASPWTRRNWDLVSPNSAPVILDWQTCPTCGVEFANWAACPDCIEAQ